jgi:hypothetical protein
MNKPEVQRAAVGETQRELEAEAMKTRDVEIVVGGDAALHFQVRRHGFTIIGEVLVHVEVVVHASDTPTLLE